MGLNEQASAERIHIGFFGLRNVGKSSVVNAVTNQRVALVSDVKGTTTDPVTKAMELLPIGAVLIIDTPGIDDEGTLGMMRVERTKDMLRKTDIAILVVDSTKGTQGLDDKLIMLFEEKNIPYIVAYNKCDLLESIPIEGKNSIYISARDNININALKEKIANTIKGKQSDKKLISDIIEKDDVVVLVTPIDESAPKGRLILPQQQAIREILDCGAIPLITRETELEVALSSLQKSPKIVVTDSKVFALVDKIIPREIMLTSFSILFARYKGDLKTVVNGALQLDKLEDGDMVLISEGCTHHRQCGDIGTVKLPKLIKKYTNKDIQFEFTSGNDFKNDLSKYSLVVHCGGCMLNEREMQFRINHSLSQNVPISNYGIVIAQINGILNRSIEPFKQTL